MSQSRNVLKEFGSVQVAGSALSAKQVSTTLDEASTLDDTATGKVFYLGDADGFTVTLPAVADAVGLQCRFVVSVAPTTAYVISSAASDIHGSVLAGPLGATAVTAGTPVNTITFAAGVAEVGDYVDVSCDGTNYYVSGASGVAVGITLTVV